MDVSQQEKDDSRFEAGPNIAQSLRLMVRIIGSKNIGMSSRNEMEEGVAFPSPEARGR
jgi:hypothetical protein